MIEGLKVTITGTELKELCENRAEFHRERVKVYSEQKTSMEAAKIEGMHYSNGDPTKAIEDRKELHEGEAQEMAFIAAHVVLNETYLLDRGDLHKLGIYRSRY